MLWNRTRVREGLRGCSCVLRRSKTFERRRGEGVKCRRSGSVCRPRRECVTEQQQLSHRKDVATGSSRLECRCAGTDLAQGHASTGPMSRRVLPSLTGKLVGHSCWAGVAGHPADVFGGGGGGVTVVVAHNFLSFSSGRRHVLPRCFLHALSGRSEVQQLSPRPPPPGI